MLSNLKISRATLAPLLTQKTNLLFLPLDLTVEHGSHNVSRWMTWLSISLKNAAACDKWYQLQNHFITESLNANGAWEKPFVGHPRACHTQCRTNKKSPLRTIVLVPHSALAFVPTVLAFTTKSPSSGEAPIHGAWPFVLVFAVRIGFVAPI